MKTSVGLMRSFCICDLVCLLQNSEGTEELAVDGEQKAAGQSQWDQERLEWEQASRDSPERGQRDKEGKI